LADLADRAHRAGDRVVLVVKSFDDPDINAITGNPTAAQNAITNTVNAVRGRGWDGVNVDFEGSTSSNYPNLQQQYTSWIANLDRQLKQALPGATLTVCSYSGSASWDSGFMRIDSLAPSVDAFFIMAYDMTGETDAPDAPLAGSYTYTDTLSVDQYVAKAGDPRKVILGVGYYGWKFSTDNQAFSPPLSSAQFAGRVAATYADTQADLACAAGAPDNLVQNWDAASSTPWAAWFSPGSGDPCGGNHNSNRESYYENARSIGAKYDLVNSRGIRGTGIWALGYDHGYTDLWNVIGQKLFSAPPAPPATYNPVGPVRIADTRTGLGGHGGPLGPGASFDLQVTGVAGVPASGVTSVLLNLTAANPSGTTWLAVEPSGSATSGTSNLNVDRSRVAAANLVLAMVGSGGRVRVSNALGTVQAIVDLVGYYAAPAAAGAYRPVTPTRILDTRNTGSMAPGQRIDLQVAGAGGVPATGAEAVELQLTALDGAARGGWAAVYPAADGSPTPTTSSINFDPGQVVSNRVVVPLGQGGRISLYNAIARADLIVDVHGWLTDSSGPNDSTGRLTALSPTRLYDSRTNGTTRGPGGILTLQMTGQGVPSMQAAIPPRAIVLNITATNTTAWSYMSDWANTQSPGIPPPTSDLNWNAGITAANLNIVPIGPDGGVQIYNSAGSADFVVDLAGWVS
ncbi:MAG TPA: glycosyl hydrolase family 18 protein, partial [Candidatus Dormibacteraeota bacterium]|nr:glycosyl hydrolase family 18 protein [Candidatus Dormibacteraeota bacterium]